jgi:hypothetical protein
MINGIEFSIPALDKGYDVLVSRFKIDDGIESDRVNGSECTLLRLKIGCKIGPVMHFGLVAFLGV